MNTDEPVPPGFNSPSSQTHPIESNALVQKSLRAGAAAAGGKAVGVASTSGPSQMVASPISGIAVASKTTPVLKTGSTGNIFVDPGLNPFPLPYPSVNTPSPSL